MATLKELRDERLRKLEELKKLGINPYPAKSERTNTLQEITEKFSELEGKDATLVGRIVSIRKFGKLAFIVIKDASGSLQLFLRDGEVEKINAKDSQIGLEQINLLDSGDFIQASGQIIKTQTGEISLGVKKLRLLTKSLRPMPTKQDGFTNKEERMRRRYIDINTNADVHDRFIRRSKFWQATRDFLNREGFIEINTPVLEHTTGGADANPFVTHMDALDQDFYLRISHELPLKRLIGAGYEKVYDIGPRFRNENYSDEHLPEHIAMEWYWAYADWRDGMKLMSEMYKYVLQETFGTLQFKIGSFDVDLSDDWQELDYGKIIQDKYGLDVFNCSLDEVKKALIDNKLEVEKTENKARGIDKLWKNIRKDIAGPAWLINTPLFISPLAKTNTDRSETVQRFQPIIAGSELGNGYSELNDPIDQLNRFTQQQKLRDAGDDEAQMLDIDFVEMLEYGMPPTCGWGFSERVFWLFEGVAAREGVPFPQLRSEIDEVTKTIYPEVLEKDVKKDSKARSQDFGKRFVAIIDKSLEPWRAVNASNHSIAYLANELQREKFITHDFFVTKDDVKLPRNSQYAMIVKKAEQKDLHKLLGRLRENKDLKYHVFVADMQDTTDDNELERKIKDQESSDINILAIAVFGADEHVEAFTKHYQLYN